jgi:hypothetical protein
MKNKFYKFALIFLFFLVSLSSFIYINVTLKNEKFTQNDTQKSYSAKKIEKKFEKKSLAISLLKDATIKLINVVLIND